MYDDYYYYEEQRKAEAKSEAALAGTFATVIGGIVGEMCIRDSFNTINNRNMEEFRKILYNAYDIWYQKGNRETLSCMQSLLSHLL